MVATARTKTWLPQDLSGQARELAVTLKDCAPTFTERKRLEREFKRCIRAAIFNSMSVVLETRRPWYSEALGSTYFIQWRGEERTKAWEQLNARIPPFSIGWVCKMERICEWLQTLQEQCLLGEIRWTDIDAGKYSYHLYRHQSSIVEFDEHIRDYDSSRDIISARAAIRRQVTRESHVHHIIDAKIHALNEYREPLPRRTALFLKEVPHWLAPLFLVVTGRIVKEEKDIYSLMDNMVTERKSMIVDKSSPAIIFGPLVLNGWSSDDVRWQDKARWLLRGGRRKPIVR